MSPSPTTTAPPPLEICSVCGAAPNWKKPPKTSRLPSGWKRQNGEVFCPVCWNKKYILRAVTLPVVSPLDCSWEELYQMLHQVWAETTTASNWMMTQFYIRDNHRQAGMVKMSEMPMPAIYLYPEAKVLFPVMARQALATLENSIGKKYRAKRKDVVWKHASSLPTHRYPTPFGVPSQAWTVSLEEGRPVVSVPLEKRIRLRLRSGPEFWRQLTAIRQMVSGAAERGQLDLFRQGEGKQTEIMCKLVAWLPRAASRVTEGTLLVRSTPDAILTAYNLRDEVIWNYHGEHLKRLVARHKKDLQFLADDSKAEMRPVPPFTRRRRMMAERFRHRMDTDTHNIAAMLVNYAKRRKFAEILYDDSDHSFADLPWAELERKVAEKANAAGIGFVNGTTAPVTASTASDEAAGKNQPPLADQ